LCPKISAVLLPCAKTLHEARFCFAEILWVILGKWNADFGNVGESSEERVNIR
jgi:hypothetical protein